MKMRRTIAGVSALVVAAGLTTACGGGSGSSSTTSADALQGKITGEITVLTHRTDIVDSVFRAKYAPEFEKLYPGTKVKFQAITTYEQDVTTRLTSGNAGDVIDIPSSISQKQLSQLLVPLGTQAELSKTYRFIPGKSYEGKAYGIPQFGNTIGIVYNKKVWKDAGLTDLPTTPDQFLTDMKQIKAKTQATPYYTNYKDKWPLTQFQQNPGVTNDPDAMNQLITDKTPWTGDGFLAISDGLLFDLVHEGVTEKDPTTTAWESSKGFLATGKIGAMMLGSWAIPQMQDAATKAGTSPADIGFMPFPYRVDGVAYANVGPDTFTAIPKSSKNKATADAWAKWFALKSGFSTINAGIPPAVDGANPKELKSFADLGVKYVEQNPFPAGKENVQSEIEKASQIDLLGGIYDQKLVDVARGAASGDKASYFASLDKAWADGISSAGS